MSCSAKDSYSDDEFEPTEAKKLHRTAKFLEPTAPLVRATSEKKTSPKHRHLDKDAEGCKLPKPTDGSPPRAHPPALAMPKPKQCFVSQAFPQVQTRPQSPPGSPSKKLPPPPEKYNALHGGPIDPSSRLFVPGKSEPKTTLLPKTDKANAKASSSFAAPSAKTTDAAPHRVKSVQSLAHEIRRIRSRTRNTDDDAGSSDEDSKPDKPVPPPTQSPPRRSVGAGRPNFSLQLDAPPKRVLQLDLGAPKDEAKAAKKRGGRDAFNLELELDESTLEKSYDLSASGTFDAVTFQIKQTGIAHHLSPTPDGPTTPRHMKKQLVKLGVLGKGASGVVHKALHVPSLLLVAVKVIPVFENEKRHQLIAEVKTLYNNMSSLTDESDRRKVACPEIVCLYDAFMNPNEGNVSIVVEYMDGGSLQDIVDTGGCTSESVLANISFRVLKGLRFLHEHHQLHRDIKPSNLLINHFGDVKVSDFGIAKEMENSVAKATTFVGTLTYMSPERIASEAYSYKSDVWSFGLSIMTCALGHYPYVTKGGYWELLHSIRNEPPPNLPASADFSAEFRDFLAKCLAKDQNERWSVKQLLEHNFLRECRCEFGALPTARAKDDEDDADESSVELDTILTKLMDHYLKTARDLVLDHAYSYDDIIAWLKLLPAMQNSKLNRFADQVGCSRRTAYSKFEHAMNLLLERIKEAHFDDE
ncbi:serine/threonine protein kinase [Achlya hypogyna]|uniref:mitogen-activated protein kinase kinase n=1 Tax=Achlya hypogyna TaxID=1202772 RepID=A0A1V9YAZ3_ACHHY|nr:serine/threonine protein kinase [Achlya hypogyna]